ncbi:MAG: AAA family ATPase, partial [Planctomycetota bacterium]
MLDFGLALGGWQPGREGELIGTPAYMSPEQARGEGHLVDARSDIFALGIVMMEMLTRKRPWESKSSRELIQEISHGRVRPLRRLDDSVPVALERICQKATAPAMSERYSDVNELAKDLQWYLSKTAVGAPDQDDESLAISTRGLRPYTVEDANEYWQLVPGQRNAKGIPDSIQWWLERIAGTTGVHRSVLVLYGPSGSGKSSLLHAGVLPFLDSREIQCVTLDASELSTPESMVRQLAAATGAASHNRDFEARSVARRHESQTSGLVTSSTPKTVETLTSYCSSLRENAACRTVIVLDQFEQVLNWSSEEHREQVAFAMRQADGARLRFVLVVRDEFWSAISRWMRDLDVPLRDGRNAMGLERFSREHAAKVLRTWADASGKIDVDDEFIGSAIELVAVGERVIPVRLALLATVLGDADWTHARLQEFSSRGSLSGYYLDSVLGELAPAAVQQFSGPAQAVLRRLTPDSGQIRGHVRSAEELKEACRDLGRNVGQSEFDDLVDRLDRQLHLITPAENANRSGAHYQLPHDFLVPELRQWLDASDQKTASGRAAVDLRHSSDRWIGDPHSRNLAGPIDCLRFGLLTRPADQQQREFVKTSALKHLLRGVVISALAAILIISFQFVLLRSDGKAVVSRLVSSSIDQLPDAIAETRKKHYWTQHPLAAKWSVAERESDEVVRDRIALVKLRDEPDQSSYLAQRLIEVEPPMRLLITRQMELDLFGDDRNAVADHLAAVLGDESQPVATRLNAAIGLGRLDPKHSAWDLFRDDLCQLLVEANPVDLGWLKDGLYPMRRRLTEGLTAIRHGNEPDKTRTATYLLAEFAADNERALVELLEKSALSELSAIAPAVSNAEPSIIQVLKSRFADRLNALEKAIETIESSGPESKSASRLAAMGTLRATLSRQIGSLGSALIFRGEGKEVLPHLRMSEDPTLRNYLIECYVSSRAQAAPLARLLLEPSTDIPRLKDGIAPDIASSLLLTLGSLPALSQVPAEVRTLAVDLYRTTKDAQLHASAEWFLNKQGYSADIAGAGFNDSVGYVTARGQTMVRLPGDVTTMVGSTTFDRNRLAN